MELLIGGEFLSNPYLIGQLNDILLDIPRDILSRFSALICRTVFTREVVKPGRSLYAYGSSEHL